MFLHVHCEQWASERFYKKKPSRNYLHSTIGIETAGEKGTNRPPDVVRLGLRHVHVAADRPIPRRRNRTVERLASAEAAVAAGKTAGGLNPDPPEQQARRHVCRREGRGRGSWDVGISEVAVGSLAYLSPSPSM
jgi:hypothetical protein